MVNGLKQPEVNLLPCFLESPVSVSAYLVLYLYCLAYQKKVIVFSLTLGSSGEKCFTLATQQSYLNVTSVGNAVSHGINWHLSQYLTGGRQESRQTIQNFSTSEETGPDSQGSPPSSFELQCIQQPQLGLGTQEMTVPLWCHQEGIGLYFWDQPAHSQLSVCRESKGAFPEVMFQKCLLNQWQRRKCFRSQHSSDFPVPFICSLCSDNPAHQILVGINSFHIFLSVEERQIQDHTSSNVNIGINIDDIQVNFLIISDIINHLLIAERLLIMKIRIIQNMLKYS